MTSPANSSVNQVLVNLSARSYSIDIGAGILKHSASILTPWLDSEHVIVFTDDVVAKLYLDPLVQQINTVAARTD